ncbi:MAG: stage II sporulation protein M [Limisphaerales bacterium]
MKKSASTIFLAVTRARAAILSVALAYVISVAIGLMLAHTGNVLALAHRNRIVGIAQTNDVSAMANNRGQPVRAALLDWSGNLRGAAVDSVLGMGVVFIYPMVAYRGWVGGIVSVEHDGTSRLRRPLAAAYYFLTLILQLTGYSLAAGAGVNLGMSMFRPRPFYQGRKWLRTFPQEAVLDVLRIYVLVVPVLAIASFWEFLSPWNP